MRDLKTIKNMILQLKYILDKKQQRQLVILFIVTFIGAFWEMLGVSVILPFIQVLMAPEELYEKWYITVISKIFNVATQEEMIFGVCFIIILIYGIKNIYLLFASYLQVQYRNNVFKKLSLQMFKSYMQQPYSFFVNISSGKIMRGIDNDILGVRDIIENSMKLVSESMVVLFIGIGLIYTDVVMALGVLCIGVITVLIIVLMSKKKLAEVGRKNRIAIAASNSLTLQIIEEIKDVIVFKKKDYFSNKFNKMLGEKSRALKIYQFAAQIPERVVEFFCVVGIFIMIMIRVSLGVDIVEFVPKLALFAMAAFRILPSISRIIGYIHGLIFNRTTLEEAYYNIKTARENSLADISTKKTISTKIEMKDSLKIVDIYWKYNEENEYILKGISFKIGVGESIGIIGESGSGKSTLVDIILGLYRPQKGTIKLDDIDVLDEYNYLTSFVGYVPQTVFLLDDTIKANVAFGENAIDDVEVWKALEKANLKQFVENLPNGLNTVIGERGVKISGGQRQRIAIARALYFKPSILILDEATSALDNDTESFVMEAINNLRGKVTMIIIAHRLTTIRNCNKIYEIKDGKIYQRKWEDISSEA